MPDNEPNTAPAAQPQAGQQPNVPPTGDLTQNIPPETPAAPSGDPNGQQPPEIRNPEAYKHAQEAARYRTENKTLAAKVAEYEAAQKAAEEAQMSELEKAQRRISEYQQQEAEWQIERQQWRIAQAVQTHAARLGIVDVDAASRLLDTSALDYDESGNPTNADALLAAMLEQRPWLRGAQTTAPAAPTSPAQPFRPSAGLPAAPARSATQGGANGGLTREIIERLTPREYQLRRDEVQDWLRTHPNG
jgi:hypothetical protein